MKNKATAVSAKDVDLYFTEQQGQERDLLHELQKSKRAAWAIAGVGVFVGLMGLAAGVAGLNQAIPEPLILRVDNATGAVEKVTNLSETETTYGEVVDTYWLNQYVLAREGYDWSSLQRNYDIATLLSSPDEQIEYLKMFQGPQARDVVLSSKAKIVTSIRSITTDTSSQIAVVRYSTEQRQTNGINGPVENWIATIGYTYSNGSMTAADRRINPLGFQITSYRSDPETVAAN